MLIGPPILPKVRKECATPGGYMSGSRGSAMFFTGVIGNAVSGYAVPEWKWRNAVIDATGSRTLIFTISAPGCDPNDVTSRQSRVVPLGSAPVPEGGGEVRFRMSRFLRSAQVSAEAKIGIPSLPPIQAALSA